MDISSIITAQEVKDWCRIDSDADDALIATLILTAQEAAAAYTGLVLQPDSCPAGVRQAVAVFAADLYANREGQTVGQETFYRLLNPHRVSVL